MNSNRNSKRPFADAVEEHCLNKNIGENGMTQYSNAGVGSDILVLSQLVRSGNVVPETRAILERRQPQEIADLFVLVFHSRSIRDGKGERKLSYDMFVEVLSAFPETACALVPLFVHYGYWKDLFKLLEYEAHNKEALRAAVMQTVKDALVKDMVALDAHKKTAQTHDNDGASGDEEKTKPLAISLLAKWLPREGKELDRKTNFVNDFVKVMWPCPHGGDVSMEDKQAAGNWQSGLKARYRRVVAELTSYLELPEVLLASQREDEISFGRLASKATLRLRKVFLNQDKSGNPRSADPKRIRLAERFMEHIVSKGLKGKQLMPHEIVAKCRRGNISQEEELVLDAQWKDLWKGVQEKIHSTMSETDSLEFALTRMVPMCDVSGSMWGLPVEVAMGLSLGLAEITHPAFKNLILTFAGNPEFHKVDPTATIVKKVKDLERAPWDMSTNFEAAYDLILEVARKNKLAREDMPSLIVFSDMQFNQASRTNKLDVMHDVIKAKVEKVAKELGWEDSDPSPMVYWNLRNTGGHPVNKDTEGTVLLSAFSPALLRMVMSGGALEETVVEVVQADGTVKTEKVRVTPEMILRKTLDDSKYDLVREILAASNEGCLKDYVLPEPLEAELGFDVL